MKNFFKWTGYLEGTSLLILLLVAMPLKYMAGEPQYVRAVGSTHGFLFIVYVMLATILSKEENWPRKKLFTAYVLSCLPFGTFIFEKKFHSVA